VAEAVSNQLSSAVAYWLGLFIGMYLMQHDLGGVTTGADGGGVPGRAPERIGTDGRLDGGEALPGFTLAVEDIFLEPSAG
jgi:hypothetical protein